MDYAKSFTFVFDDPRWKEKIAIGGGLVLVSSLLSVIIIGILGFFILAGYSIRLLQNVRDSDEFPLPEWDDWGGDFIRGLKFAVVGIIWALPIIVFTVPLVIGGAIADSGGAGEFFGVIILLCAGCLMFLYGIFVFLASPGFTISYATDERIASGLQITDIWHWTQANIGQIVVAVLVVMLVNMAISIVASIAGTVLCLIGLIITLPLSGLAISLYQHHVYGQLAYEFPYGGMGGPATLPPVESTDLAASPDTAIIDAPADETIEVDETAETDDSPADVAGDEEKPA